MSTIADPTLAAIAGGTSTGGLSKKTAHTIFRIARLLLASRSLNDVSVFAQPHVDTQNRFVVPVLGKWSISFVMTDNGGPDDLRLEKTGKSWPDNPKPSSRRNVPATS